MKSKPEFKNHTTRFKPLLWPFFLLLFIVSCKTTLPVITDEDEEMTVVSYMSPEEASAFYLEYRTQNELGGDPLLRPFVRVSEVNISTPEKHIDIIFNPRLADFPIRPHTISLADSLIRSKLAPEFEAYTISMYTMGYNLFDLIPNYFRTGVTEVDHLRRPLMHAETKVPLVRNLDNPWHAASGLDGRHVALWHSHGWYYNIREQRWEWQRPRLFNTTEDMLPMAFTIPYIIPMLEAAGAHVWVPRERDIQHHMVIVDNDMPTSGGRYHETVRSPYQSWRDGTHEGFTPEVLPLLGNVNPFQEGTWRYTYTDSVSTSSISWIPDIPETGEYAVYISYASGSEFTADARYTVHHTGGSTRFAVNQQLGGGTWLYLGHFHFREGMHPESGAVTLSNQSLQYDKKISADAVRFGGGMGLVERNGRTSERPRFLEGARYHMQFTGAPDTLVWKLNENNDYSDDFQGRGEWVNFLRGTPFGPNLDRSVGLGIPIELSLSFHTDAGVTRNDTVIGTLSIYTIGDVDGNTNFPDGMSRLANRDLTDIMQTQLVDDIRALHDPTWVRRALRNARYSESMRPNVPSTLLELLSHQNFRDKEYAMDPHFRFDVSRSIYKSMLRFIADQHGLDYVVQPLPVTHMMSEFVDDGVRLRWKQQHDPLEPSATPTAYVLYTRLDDGGFDNGKAVADTSIVLRDLLPGKIYSFKVRAANDGGLSMPSEIIAVTIASDASERPVLVVNGFTRVAAPAVIKEPTFRGFAHFIDAGVPDGLDIGFSGEQYNFDIYDDWVSDDRPGHGASHADYETQVIAGNTRDFSYTYAKAFSQLGFSVATVSEAAINDGLVHPSIYPLVAVILGKQRQTPSINPFAEERNGLRYGIYSEGMRTFLSGVASSGGGIFISGAHVGTDLVHRPQPDSSVIAFASDILGYEHITNYASKSGRVFGAPMTPFTEDSGKVSSVNDGGTGTTLQASLQGNDVFLPRGLDFNTEYSRYMYRVDAPDAIGPSRQGSLTLMRYAETEFSAAVGYKGIHRVVTFGFPFETINGESQRKEVLEAVLEFLKQ
ncbi:MAG: xanthan lyase [Bacteroidetes bacterium]|nr:xanthan lyase [Bacteroidota bacterium]MCH8524118.1 hypothetical protein [Balneolales bacterium]